MMKKSETVFLSLESSNRHLLRLARQDYRGEDEFYELSIKKEKDGAIIINSRRVRKPPRAFQS